MFSLNFEIPLSASKIRLKDHIVSIGSCFADNIGSLLSTYKFDCASNPFGSIYNPVSISELLVGDIHNDEIIESQGVYFHWQAHGQVAAMSAKELDHSIQEINLGLQKKLKSTDWLIVTLGSAFAYRLNASNRIVANCHKVPQSEFTKVLLEIEQMEEALVSAFLAIKSINPNLKVILTVSPVRHVRDGLIKNNRSKGRLLEVVHSLDEKHDWIHYFPAYEIQIDELRDYRFFAKDRVHPSDESVEYIWQKFGQTYFDDETNGFVKEWRRILGMVNHRPIHPKSSEHQAFIKKTIQHLQRLASDVDVQEEIAFMQKQLSR